MVDYYSVSITQYYVVSRYLPGGVVGQVGGVQVGILLPVRTHRLNHLPSNFIARFLQTQTLLLQVRGLHYSIVTPAEQVTTTTETAVYHGNSA